MAREETQVPGDTYLPEEPYSRWKEEAERLGGCTGGGLFGSETLTDAQYVPEEQTADRLSWNDEPTRVIGRGCPWCSSQFVQTYHPGACPKVRSLEYWPDGALKRVEFWMTPEVARTP